MSKDRSTPRQIDRLRVQRAARRANASWRERLAAKYSGLAVGRRKERAAKKREAAPAVVPPPVRFVHETADLEWARPVRRRAQLNLRSRTGDRSRRIPPSPNVPYVNPDRDLKKARAAARRTR